MRISPIEMHRRIEDVQSRLTDQEVFAGREFAAYLTDLAETVSRRYGRTPIVRVGWEEAPDANIAFTDNRRIYINAGNQITQSFPSRQLRYASLVGLLGHEVGHLLFTDFTLAGIYNAYLLGGRMYPCEPDNLSGEETAWMEEFREGLSSKEPVFQSLIRTVTGTLENILEDAYIENRICQEYPGAISYGIHLFNLRFLETVPSIQQQIARKYQPYAIFTNLLLQYCLSGEVNNLGGYEGEYLDSVTGCIPLVDGCIYDLDARTRYDAVNRILIRIWPIIRKMAEDARKRPKAPEKIERELSAQIARAGGNPIGGSKPVPGGKPMAAGLQEKLRQEREEVKEALGRIPLAMTERIEDNGDGGLLYDRQFGSSGAADTAAEIERFLHSIARERVNRAIEAELCAELQAESNRISYGNNHGNLQVTVHRMPQVPQNLVDSYHGIAGPLLRISGILQKKVLAALKEDDTGGIRHTYMGGTLDSRALYRADGAIFTNWKLPGGKKTIAAAVLVDESGSMKENGRIDAAKATGIILYDFCRGLEIPVSVYGHTASNSKPIADIYAYADFDSVDGNDKYRMMDMTTRDCNRDGAAIRFVAERLLKRPEDIRLLFILSDGQPNACGYSGTAAEADLRGIRQEYSNKGIILFAAAIGEDRERIKRIYGEGFLDITELDTLPQNLTRQLARYVRL